LRLGVRHVTQPLDAVPITPSRRFSLRPLAPILNLIAAAVLLMGVAFADGRPSVFYDSDSYDLVGKDIQEIIGKAPASLNFQMKPGLDIGDDPVSHDDEMDDAMMGARSAWYGLFMRAAFNAGELRGLFGGPVKDSAWVLAALQALIGAWVLRLIWRTAAPKAPGWTYVALAGAMTLLSTLPFFVTFAMPDVFAGFESVAIVLAMLYWDRLRRWEIGLLWALLVGCASFHGSHPILAVPLVLGAALLAWRLGASLKGQLLRAVYVASAVVVGMGMVKVYDHAYEVRTGRELHHPPFIMARMLVDGPGKRYLLDHCVDDVTPFVVCRYRFQPMNDTDIVLWSDDPENGVWNVETHDNRVLMEKQEIPFALAVFASDPVGQTVASTKNWLTQVGMFWVEDPIRNPQVFFRDAYWGARLKPLIPNAEECKPMGPGCATPFYQAPLAVWHGLWILLGLGFAAWRLSRKDVRDAVLKRRPDWSSSVVRLVAAALVLVAATLINAAVCGVFSGTFTRYEGRVIWLLPLVGGLTACVLVPQRAIATAKAWLLAAEAKLAALAAGARLPGWVEPIVARVRAHPLGRRIDAQFIQFGCVSVFGLTVDFCVLQLFMDVAQFNVLLARFLSFTVAVAATWIANRVVTFREHSSRDRALNEASSYFVVQCVAFALNFGVFQALVRAFPDFSQGLAVFPPFFAGAVAGFGVNYFGARYLVFRAPRATPAE
jgi:putative flippase GtrA